MKSWRKNLLPYYVATHVFFPLSYDFGFSAWLVDSSESYYVTGKINKTHYLISICRVELLDRAPGGTEY